jgi:hypothetical protein
MRYPGEEDGVGADEQQLADLLKRVVPEPLRQLTYEEITVRTAERTVKSWLMPTLAAASVLVIGGAVGAVAATRSTQAAPGAPAAYQATSRAGSATPSAQPTSPGCQPTAEPSPTVQGGTVKVPSVIGQQLAAAVGNLQRFGLIVTIEETASRTVPAGIVLLESPAAGSPVLHGATVTLTISSGPAGAKATATAATPVPLPTCLPAGSTAAGGPSPAPTAAAGSAVPTPVPTASGGGQGAVPTAAVGTAVPSPTAISGDPSAVATTGVVHVPSLVGQNSLTAVHTAQDAGLRVVVTDKAASGTRSVPAGVVWGQAPTSGSVVPAGGTITLYCQP